MNYRTLGSIGRKLSEISLDAWTTHAGHAGTFRREPVSAPSAANPPQVRARDLPGARRWRYTAGRLRGTGSRPPDRPARMNRIRTEPRHGGRNAHRAFALLLLAGLATADIPALRMDAGRAGAAPRGQPAMADPEVRGLVRLVNEHRVRIGCPPLAWDARLAWVAEKHSADMARRGFFAHVNPDGDDSFDRIQDSMIEFHSAGENIAAGQGTAREVFAAWMGSRRHRANLENCLCTHHGIGRFQNRWTHVFVQLSATSL